MISTILRTSSIKTEPLFPPFHFERWKAVDDRVRGGSSTSHLDPIFIGPRSSSSTTSATSKVEDESVDGYQAARFWGTLDTKTLGGAGFASQAFFYAPFPLNLTRIKYAGVGLTLLPSNHPPPDITSTSTPNTFTLVLKTTPTSNVPKHPKVPPPPRAASLTYEVSFTISSLQSGEVRSLFGWEDFKAFYRGREVKEDDERYVVLDSSTIYEISLMCRSNFGKQEGDFDLIVKDISAWLKDNVDVDVKEENEEELGWVWKCWYSLTSWFKGIMGWQRIRLNEEEEEDEKAGLIV